MPKKCETKQPSFRVAIHVPEASWHGHWDKVVHVKAATEWEAWSQFMLKVLALMAGGNARLMVGYWLDALNSIPTDLRAALVQGITAGLGLQIEPDPDDPTTIVVNVVRRYEPLGKEQPTTKSGLVLPDKTVDDLVLPGSPEFQR